MTGAAAAGLDAFMAERPRLRALAYRMLGSLSDADDVVQEVWLRWAAADRSGVAAPAGFLTTVTARLALDRLRAARASRETYVGTWLPEPAVVPADGRGEGAGAGEDSVPLALLTLMERLTPEQRTVYVLRTALEMDYAAVAGVLGRSPDACRQIMRRARDALAGPPRFAPDRGIVGRIAEAFRDACDAGDHARLVALLAGDAVMLADGGGVVRTALNPIRGAGRIARLLLGLRRKHGLTLAAEPLRVNGGPGFAVLLGGRFHGVLALDTDAGAVTRLYLMVNPTKLHTVGGPAAGR
ncbi:RNA polymerase sigma factor SigJ [Azospirillum halopraeferens]|uniref:RNA polymerase sigma factor SigJ n=1 Tax=Azospirillum halopraeferens TaxID=34010 RepID=UPI000421F6BA|nr:RNA polymerase sigma factor SigJ [Azospirillum halopraeferens]